MHKQIRSIVVLWLLLSVSCAGVIPKTETVIRLPQEHEYVAHNGRIPMIYIRTFPREYWDFALSFQPRDVNGVLKAGEALYATLQEGLGTAFKVTQRAASGDFLAMVDLGRFKFSYAPLGDRLMEFRSSLEFVIVDDVGRKVDTVSLDAKTSIEMPEGAAGQVRAASGAVAELLSIMEKELAKHTAETWKEGRYPI